jgi:hypothetical protein
MGGLFPCPVIVLTEAADDGNPLSHGSVALKNRKKKVKNKQESALDRQIERGETRKFADRKPQIQGSGFQEPIFILYLPFVANIMQDRNSFQTRGTDREGFFTLSKLHPDFVFQGSRVCAEESVGQVN